MLTGGLKMEKKEIKIIVGIEAYEIFYNTKVEMNLSIDKNKYRAGVCVEHIPTGMKIYLNDMKSQYQNKNRALDLLRKKLETQK